MNGTTETRTPRWAGRVSDEQRRAANTPWLILRLGVWSVFHFLFYFLQQLAELLAPLLLVAGLGWWALPHVVGAITTQSGAAGGDAAGGSSGAGADSQMHDILNSISGTIPTGVHLAGHWITPGGLIFDGLLLMAAAAIGATLSALAARKM